MGYRSMILKLEYGTNRKYTVMPEANEASGQIVGIFWEYQFHSNL